MTDNENGAIDIDELERIAKAATQGEWERLHDGQNSKNVNCKCAQVWDKAADHAVAYCDTKEMGEGFSDDLQMANALHIATFDPPTVLALLSRLRAAEAETAEAHKRLDFYGVDGDETTPLDTRIESLEMDLDVAKSELLSVTAWKDEYQQQLATNGAIIQKYEPMVDGLQERIGRLEEALSKGRWIHGFKSNDPDSEREEFTFLSDVNSLDEIREMVRTNKETQYFLRYELTLTDEEASAILAPLTGTEKAGR